MNMAAHLALKIRQQMNTASRWMPPKNSILRLLNFHRNRLMETDEQMKTKRTPSIDGALQQQLQNGQKNHNKMGQIVSTHHQTQINHPAGKWWTRSFGTFGKRMGIGTGDGEDAEQKLLRSLEKAFFPFL